MSAELLERMRIREVIENWVLWRDSARWDDLRTCYHRDGSGCRPWRGSRCTGRDAFLELAKAPRPRGGPSGHVLGGTAVTLAGARAIAETKVTIQVRAPVEGVLCDVLAAARFYDFFERREDVWAIALRQLIYEKDRIDPIDPAGPRPVLDPALLASYPEAIRYFAYIQVRSGWDPKRDTPTLRSPECERLYEAGRRWLEGDALAWH